MFPLKTRRPETAPKKPFGINRLVAMIIEVTSEETTDEVSPRQMQAVHNRFQHISLLRNRCDQQTALDQGTAY